MSWDHIVNNGSTSWKVFEGDKPSAELSNVCNALPDVPDLNNVGQPQQTSIAAWNIQRPSPFGGDLYNIEVTLLWENGAKYKNGGAFIPNCWLAVPNSTVGWGFDINLQVDVTKVWNHGSSTAPIGALELVVSGTIASPIWNQQYSRKLGIGGNGAIII